MYVTPILSYVPFLQTLPGLILFLIPNSTREMTEIELVSIFIKKVILQNCKSIMFNNFCSMLATSSQALSVMMSTVACASSAAATWSCSSCHGRWTRSPSSQ